MQAAPAEFCACTSNKPGATHFHPRILPAPYSYVPGSPLPNSIAPLYRGRNRDPRTRENLPMSTRFLSTVNCTISEHRRPPIDEARVVKLIQNRPLCELRVFFGPFFARVLPKTACSCDRVFTGHFPRKHSLTRSTAARPCRRSGRRASGPWPCRRYDPR